MYLNGKSDDRRPWEEFVVDLLDNGYQWSLFIVRQST